MKKLLGITLLLSINLFGAADGALKQRQTPLYTPLDLANAINKGDVRTAVAIAQSGHVNLLEPYDGRIFAQIARDKGNAPLSKLLELHSKKHKVSQFAISVAYKGDLKSLEQALEKQKSVDLADPKTQITPLWAAANNANTDKHLDIIRFLLQKGANPNFKNRNGESPFFTAANKGHINALKAMFTKSTIKADPNLADTHGNTPLHMATLHNHKDTVKFLLNTTNAKALIYNKDGKTPARIAHEQNFIAIRDMLGEKEIKEQPNAYRLSWQVVLRTSQTSIPQIRTKTVDRTTSDGNSPLHIAAYSGHLAIVQILIEEGAHPALKNHDGYTPIDAARWQASQASTEEEKKRFEDIAAYLDTVVQHYLSR